MTTINATTIYTHNKDNGKSGKNFEVRVRAAITPRTKVRRCKSMGKVDHYIYINGERVNIEIKTGAGTLDYNINGHIDTNIPATDHIDTLLENTNYIIYNPAWDGEDVLENAWVYTREEFVEMLHGYKGMVKYTRKGNTTINIQTFSNSKKRATYIWNQTMDKMTLGEWLETIR